MSKATTLKGLKVRLDSDTGPGRGTIDFQKEGLGADIKSREDLSRLLFVERAGEGMYPEGLASKGRPEKLSTIHGALAESDVEELNMTLLELTDPINMYMESGWVNGWNQLPSAFLSYLTERGVLPEEVLEHNHRRLAPVSAIIWDKLSAKATRQAREEGVVLTPLLAKVLTCAVNMYRVNDVPTKLWTLEKDQAARERIDSATWGEGVREALENLTNWISNEPDPAVIEICAKDPNRLTTYFKFLEPLIAANSPVIQQAGSNGKVARFFGNQVEHCLANPYLDQASYTVLADYAIAQILNEGTSSQGQKFLAEGAKRGIRLTDGQVRILKSSWALRGGMENRQDALAFRQIREVAQDEEVKAVSLAPEAKPMELAEVLTTYQGREFVQILGRITASTQNAYESEQTKKSLRRAMEHLSSWNIEGLTGAEIVDIMASPDKEIREVGLEIAKLIRSREKTQASRPADTRKPASAGRAR